MVIMDWYQFGLHSRAARCERARMRGNYRKAAAPLDALDISSGENRRLEATIELELENTGLGSLSSTGPLEAHT